MKPLFCVSVLIIFFLAGCQNNFQEFQEHAIELASDEVITSQEFAQLSRQVNASPNIAQQFRNESGTLDSAQFQDYLVKLFAAKLPARNVTVYNPSVDTGREEFNFHVFLENSASMDGYVHGITEFETAIYNLLGDLKISDFCDSLNLYYINNSIPYQKTNAMAADLEDFIEKLEPSEFRQKGGDRSASDLKNILNNVLQTVDQENAAILISDFVFSPGNNANAQDYLSNQSVGIKIDFAEKMKTTNLALSILQLNSSFNGFYYDQYDKPVSINGQRPYYIWLFGTKDQLAQIQEAQILENIIGGYQNKLTLAGIGTSSEPEYKILYKPRLGEFSARSLAEGMITQAKPAKGPNGQNLFRFNLAVDFSQVLQEQPYFLDASNYRVNPNYELEISWINDSEEYLNGYTHQLQLQTDALREEIVEVELMGKIPQWIYTSSTENDTGMAGNSNLMDKTFGLSYLIEGVYGAFYPAARENIISEIKITVKK
ncbi:MAG: hypothetical protein ACNS62_11950 [Candidatus Cyclobacteriaceae bacterium M3_2C_046]